MCWRFIHVLSGETKAPAAAANLEKALKAITGSGAKSISAQAQTPAQPEAAQLY